MRLTRGWTLAIVRYILKEKNDAIVFRTHLRMNANRSSAATHLYFCKSHSNNNFFRTKLYLRGCAILPTEHFGYSIMCASNFIVAQRFYEIFTVSFNVIGRLCELRFYVEYNHRNVLIRDGLMLYPKAESKNIRNFMLILSALGFSRNLQSCVWSISASVLVKIETIYICCHYIFYVMINANMTGSIKEK